MLQQDGHGMTLDIFRLMRTQVASDGVWPNRVGQYRQFDGKFCFSAIQLFYEMVPIRCLFITFYFEIPFCRERPQNEKM